MEKYKNAIAYSIMDFFFYVFCFAAGNLIVKMYNTGQGNYWGIGLLVCGAFLLSQLKKRSPVETNDIKDTTKTATSKLRVLDYIHDFPEGKVRHEITKYFDNQYKNGQIKKYTVGWASGVSKYNTNVTVSVLDRYLINNLDYKIGDKIKIKIHW